MYPSVVSQSWVLPFSRSPEKLEKWEAKLKLRAFLSSLYMLALSLRTALSLSLSCALQVALKSLVKSWSFSRFLLILGVSLLDAVLRRAVPSCTFSLILCPLFTF